MRTAGLAARLGLAFILIVLGSIYANSYTLADEMKNGITYEHIGEKIVITGYTGDDADVRIPEMIDGKYVSEIGEFAFYRTQVRNIMLPDCIEKIGENAFYRAENLVGVNIPDGLTEIENGVFSGCVALEEIIIPQNIKSIKSGVFGGCSAMKRIVVDKRNSRYKDVDGVLYTKDGKILVAYPNGRGAESYKVEDGTEEIMEFAFYCSDIKFAELPESVTKIGASAFLKACLLEKANVPSGVKSIDETTFACCRNLKELVISPDIEIIR